MLRRQGEEFTFAYTYLLLYLETVLCIHAAKNCNLSANNYCPKSTPLQVLGIITYHQPMLLCKHASCIPFELRTISLQFFGFCRTFELGKRPAGQRRYGKEGILRAVACACFLLNLLPCRRIKPIVMGASFPNPTVYEPLAVESFPRPLFFSRRPLALAGMREEFLYGLIIDLIKQPLRIAFVPKLFIQQRHRFVVARTRLLSNADRLLRFSAG